MSALGRWLAAQRAASLHVLQQFAYQLTKQGITRAMHLEFYVMRRQALVPVTSASRQADGGAEEG
jgi:hypothetical protein